MMICFPLRSILWEQFCAAIQFSFQNPFDGADLQWRSLPQAEAPTEPAGETAMRRATIVVYAKSGTEVPRYRVRFCSSNPPLRKWES